jgi:hypothetical protein
MPGCYLKLYHEGFLPYSLLFSVRWLFYNSMLFVRGAGVFKSVKRVRKCVWDRIQRRCPRRPQSARYWREDNRRLCVQRRPSSVGPWGQTFCLRWHTDNPDSCSPLSEKPLTWCTLVRTPLSLSPCDAKCSVPCKFISPVITSDLVRLHSADHSLLVLLWQFNASQSILTGAYSSRHTDRDFVPLPTRTLHLYLNTLIGCGCSSIGDCVPLNRSPEICRNDFVGDFRVKRAVSLIEHYKIQSRLLL